MFVHEDLSSGMKGNLFFVNIVDSIDEQVTPMPFPGLHKIAELVPFFSDWAFIAKTFMFKAITVVKLHEFNNFLMLLSS
jgi:hypothetical protein